MNKDNAKRYYVPEAAEQDHAFDRENSVATTTSVIRNQSFFINFTSAFRLRFPFNPIPGVDKFLLRNTLCVAAVGLSIILLTQGFLQSANAATAASQFKILPVANQYEIRVGLCWRRIGPFGTQHAAERARRVMQSRGFNTSAVYGQGGLYSGWQNRQFYFKIFFPC